MDYLIDTHVFLWLINGDKKLSEIALKHLKNLDNKLYLNVCSLWEISIKINIGKLKVERSILELLEDIDLLNIEIIPFSPDLLSEYQTLPLVKNHRDPFDRMLVAHTKCFNIPILSADTKLDLYDVERIW